MPAGEVLKIGLRLKLTFLPFKSIKVVMLLFADT